MALEMFLKVDGVDGGTRNYQHRGWADITSWDWHLDRVAAANAAPVLRMNRITVTKPIGRESAAMMRLFTEGTTIKRAEISAIPVVGKREAVQKILGITMENIRIASIHTGGALDDGVFSEQLVLAFARVTYDYYQHGAPSAAGAAGDTDKFEFTWDMNAKPPA